MQFKQGDRVECIDESGNVRYKGIYLGSGHPGAGVGVKDRSKIHHAVQVNDSGDTVYLAAPNWSLRLAR